MGQNQSTFKSVLANKDILVALLQPTIDKIIEEDDPRQYSDRKHAPRHRDRSYALKEMDSLTDSQFTTMFRLNRQTFYWLLFKIKPLLTAKGSLYNNTYHSEHVVDVKTKLAVTLRWLAGGSYLDICFAFGLSNGSFFRNGGVLWGTMAAIDRVLDISFPLDDIKKLNEISNGFSKCCADRLKGCVMAIDGWVCRTRCPSVNESINQTSFRNRKGFFGLVCMAGCDSECRFLLFSAQCHGATNDSLAWQLSEIYRTVIQPEKLPKQFYIISDEAVSANEFVLSPYPGRGIGLYRDSFNYHLSAMRQCIERAFGMLTRRWGIFWRPLTCDMSRWPLIITVCAKLHNVCIDFKVMANQRNPNDIYTSPEDHEEGDDATTFMNVYHIEQDGLMPVNSQSCSKRRLDLTAYLKENDYVRPPHSKYSRAV